MSNRFKVYQSRQYAFAAGSAIEVDLSFLEAAKGHFRFPVIEDFIIEALTTQTTAVVGVAGIDAAGVFGQVRVNDGHGPRFDALTGHEIRALNIHEFGDAAPDLPVSGVGAGQLVNVLYHLPFSLPYRSASKYDSACPLSDMINGGSVRMTWPAAIYVVTGGNSATITAGNYRLYARVREADRGALKARVVWRSDAINNLEDHYRINGRLRAAFPVGRNGLNYGLTSWTGAGVTELDSDTLGYQDRTRLDLLLGYRGNSRGFNAVDPWDSGDSFPVWWAEMGQTIKDMPLMRTLHLRWNGALPVGQNRLVTCVVTDRDPALAAAAMGYDSADELARDLDQNGVIDPKDGRAKGIAELPPTLVKHLPVRISRSMVKR